MASVTDTIDAQTDEGQLIAELVDKLTGGDLRSRQEQTLSAALSALGPDLLGQLFGAEGLGGLLGGADAATQGLTNQAIAASSTGAQQLANRIRGATGAAGFGGSGIGESIAASAELSGPQATSRLLLEEAARQDEQKRADLGQIAGILGPLFLGSTEIGAGIDAAEGADDTTAQILGAIGGIGGGLASNPAIFCWVAREVFGESDPRWLQARDYMINLAPDDLFLLYAEHGEELARQVRFDPELKAELLPSFEALVERVEEWRHGR